MNRKHFLWIILDLIFLVVFNVVFFMLGGTKHEISVWISYGFIHLAYIMMLATCFLIRKGSSSAVFGFSLYSISALYFIIVFVVGLIFIFIPLKDYRGYLVFHVVLAGVYAILLLINLIANEATAGEVAKHEIELKYVKECSGRIKGIADRIDDKKIKKKLEDLYDLIHSSPVKSSPAVRDYELRVWELISMLESNINNGGDYLSTMSEIERNASERNRVLKYSR